MTAAAASLVKGYLPKQDSAAIVGKFWLLAASLRTHVYRDRIESKSNLADGSSRNSYQEIISLGGTWASPRTSTLGSPENSPSLGFGTPSLPGEKT